MGNTRWHRCEVRITNPKGRNESLECYVEEGVPRGEIKKRLREYLRTTRNHRFQLCIIYFDPRPVNPSAGEKTILIKKRCLITPEKVIYQ